MKAPRIVLGLLLLPLLGLFPQGDLFASSHEIRSTAAPFAAPIHASRLSSSSIVDKLQSDVADFDKNLTTYINAATKLDNDIQTVLKGLDLINTLGQNLDKLDKAMTTVEKLIKYAQAIPQTEAQADRLADQMSTLHPPVTKANNAVGNFNTKIAPTRQKLQSLDGKLQKFISAAQKFETKLNKYTDDIAKAQKCISALPDGQMKDDLQKRLDQLAGESDKRVVEANRILKGILDKVSAAEKKITDEISKIMQPIDDLETDIAALLKRLTGIINPLKDLEALFDKSFCVTFPYWAPTWKHPKRTKDFTLCIGFDIILQGEEKIKKEMEHILGKFLFDAAKAFGIEKLVNSLLDQGKKALKPVLEALDLNFDIKLPGLPNLEPNLGALTNALNDLAGLLDIDTSGLEKLFSDLEADFREMENIYANCK